MSLHRKANRRRGLVLAAAALLGLPAAAQYPGQISDKAKAAGPELRSVAVLEWVGDLKHPKASRLIPVSVWDGQQLQDGGIYLARPQPLALDSGTEYEIQKNGKNIGFYDLKEAASQQGAWIGLGGFKPLPQQRSAQQLALAAAKQKVDVDDADSDVPVLHRKQHADDPASGKTAGGTAGAKAPAPDPDRPTLHKSPEAASAGNNDPAPAPDPDRPRLHADAGPANSTGSDPDRPKLHAPAGNEVAHVSDLPNITDPDRPRLRRGQPAEYGPSVKPKLVGLPAEMNQSVAISDARSIKEHPWDFTWANATDEAKMKSDLEDTARKALGLDATAAAAPAQAKTRRASVHRKVAAPAPAPPAPLVDEEFRVFQLQYGAAATLVLSAHTEGTGAQQKFVTLIAKPNLYGGLVVLLQHVTDGAHLDLNPRMRLIDAVDALADNRGELLFELRGRSERQFALYRVLSGQATRIFTSGASYWAVSGE